MTLCDMRKRKFIPMMTTEFHKAFVLLFVLYLLWQEIYQWSWVAKNLGFPAIDVCECVINMHKINIFLHTAKEKVTNEVTFWSDVIGVKRIFCEFWNDLKNTVSIAAVSIHWKEWECGHPKKLQKITRLDCKIVLNKKVYHRLLMLIADCEIKKTVTWNRFQVGAMTASVRKQQPTQSIPYTDTSHSYIETTSSFDPQWKKNRGGADDVVKRSIVISRWRAIVS